MISLADWLIGLSRGYSVQHIDDVEEGVLVKPVNGDVYLVKNSMVESLGG